MINEYENKMLTGISKKDELDIASFFEALASTKKKSQAGRKKKLTPELQKQVVEQYATGEYTHRQLAEAAGVSTETIRRTLQNANK
ncbi:helix-turn-helix domain-containing protein [Aeromonas veronii]|uniref:helix-turn-helix domain-containing protein n=1 Tax=Aeromonas veronii TaxID=654 RepID=UPI003B9E86C9